MNQADSCTEGYECPFEELTITPAGDGGLEWMIAGQRRDGEQVQQRYVTISSLRLAEIARDHLRSRHGVTDPQDATLEQSGHAMAIAAVACLMD